MLPKVVTGKVKLKYVQAAEAAAEVEIRGARELVIARVGATR